MPVNIIRKFYRNEKFIYSYIVLVNFIKNKNNCKLM